MENNFVVILYGLATWRLTSLLIREEGPFELFVMIRKALGILHDDSKAPIGYPNTFAGKLFECSWCLSVWIAGGLTLAYIFLPSLAMYFVFWLSLSTLTILIDEVI